MSTIQAVTHLSLQELSIVSSTGTSASPSPPTIPTNDDIEAVIQLATSSCPPGDARQLGKDTRTQLFVGNVRTHTHAACLGSAPSHNPPIASLQLPYRIRWQDLKDLFRKAGTVLRADVSIGPDNRSRGFGTVLLASAEDAGRAIDMFHGFTWQTRTLEVRPDRIPPDLINPTLPGSGVGYVAPGPTTSGIGVPSTTYGSNPIMASGPSPLHASTNVHRDFDFSPMRGLERPRSSTTASRALFVGNVSAVFHLIQSHTTPTNVQLPFHCQWQDLKDLFRQAGAVIRADVTLGADGRSRGFGTVVFASEADADHAVKLFNGSDFPLRRLDARGSLSVEPPPQLRIQRPYSESAL